MGPLQNICILSKFTVIIIVNIESLYEYALVSVFQMGSLSNSVQKEENANGTKRYIIQRNHPQVALLCTILLRTY